VTAIELISLIASIVSLVLGVGAIWLSVVFFKMSNEASKATTEASKGIDASVKRLENLFDKLYSDTFSMMKDTVSDMRKHIWNGGDLQSAAPQPSKDSILEEADRKAEEKVAEVKKAMDAQLSEILDRQRVSDGNLTEVKQEMKNLLESAIQTSRQIDSEAREETVREHILSELRRAMRVDRLVTADELVASLSENIPSHRVIDELRNMRNEGSVYYEGRSLRPSSVVKIPRIKGSFDRTEP
jgi:uncharacterized membrane protein